MGPPPARHGWDSCDRVMAEDRRVAVLITPQRTYSNPTG